MIDDPARRMILMISGFLLDIRATIRWQTYNPFELMVPIGVVAVLSSIGDSDSCQGGAMTN